MSPVLLFTLGNVLYVLKVFEASFEHRLKLLVMMVCSCDHPTHLVY